MADQPKHRLTDAELDEAFAQAHGSLRLTAALAELKERRAAERAPLTQQTITICTVHGDRAVAARVIGEWAAHPKWDGSSGWSVSHVPSGRECAPPIGVTIGEAQACAVATALHEQIGKADYPELPRDRNDVPLTPAMRREGKRIGDVVKRCLFPEVRRG